MNGAEYNPHRHEQIMKQKQERATFAAGCFWHVEHEFRKIKGVVATRVGYTGGITENPAYGDVCTGRTGHAEAVDILFNPEIVSYDELLDVFWYIHDPTQHNRQGPDVGTQYRSAIFYHTETQREQALKSRERLQATERYNRRIDTEIVPAGKFWQAEEYHQRYYEKNCSPSCCTQPFQ